MDRQLVQVLSNSLGKELVKWILVREEISNYLKQNPINNETFILDLNPSLVIQSASKTVAKTIVDSGFDCSSEEVILFWLTESLLDKSKQTLQSILQHKNTDQEVLQDLKKEEQIDV